ncbi:HPGDS [Branchiostoma lanceolatum]|uniref:glutathione transferase n=1 Tax=Branchiostoma lanceolatum TaxID=7740 RepID=A0A8K0EDB7_BRALA|nr:HPGDS [Branchiostoma lanceolatum]
MPAYKLTYFNARGRAEPIRLLFAAAGIKYEDVRIEGADWPALKPKTPMGYLPILEVDGATLCESTAIARFVAKRAGLVGKDDLQQAKADMIVDGMKDILKKLILMVLEKDEIKKEELKTDISEKTLPEFLSKYENLANPSGFFVGDSLSWADVDFYNLIERVRAMFPGDHLKGKPNLVKVMANVKANPGIAKWVKERPESAF